MVRCRFIKAEWIRRTTRFLKSNYVEDDDHRFDYSKVFLKWHLNPPGYYPELLISVLLEDRVKNKKKW